MPFLVRWPGRVAPGSVTHQTVCFTDLLATFAAMTDAPVIRRDLQPWIGLGERFEPIRRFGATPRLQFAYIIGWPADSNRSFWRNV